MPYMQDMKIMILGSTGMLGASLIREAKKRKIHATGCARKDADITLDITHQDSLEKVLQEIKPNVLINAAALVNHAACEEDPVYAAAVNARAVSTLASAARRQGFYLIQISTDHYYTGERDRKHKETDPVQILNAYARTKHEGENFAIKYENALVVRTNIVGFRKTGSSLNTPSFVEWILQTLKDGSPMTMYDDYFTSSIHVDQLSGSLFDLLSKHPKGIINMASRDVTSKKGFIEEFARQFDLELTNAKTGSVKELTHSRRAESLGLDVTYAESLLGYHLPSLNEVVMSLKNCHQESGHAV